MAVPNAIEATGNLSTVEKYCGYLEYGYEALGRVARAEYLNTEFDYAVYIVFSGIAPTAVRRAVLVASYIHFHQIHGIYPVESPQYVAPFVQEVESVFIFARCFNVRSHHFEYKRAA